jgi:hypothetical protein
METQTNVKSSSSTKKTSPASHLGSLLGDQPEFLSKLFIEFKLRTVAQSLIENWPEMTEEEQKALLKYLLLWIATEKTARKSALIESRIVGAKFRKIQTVEMFDFKHSKLTEKIEKSYLTLHQNLDREHLPNAIFPAQRGLEKPI